VTQQVNVIKRVALSILVRPGRWLLAALSFDLAMYATSTREYPEGMSVTPWVLLDLFLFWRIWRGGTKARTVLIFLTLLAVVLGVFAVVGGLFTDAIIDPGLVSVLCSLGSLLCLLVPALDPQERPFARNSSGMRVDPVRASGNA
jgi:hypothetical protein